MPSCARADGLQGVNSPALIKAIEQYAPAACRRRRLGVPSALGNVAAWLPGCLGAWLRGDAGRPGLAAGCLCAWLGGIVACAAGAISRAIINSRHIAPRHPPQVPEGMVDEAVDEAPADEAGDGDGDAF
jgi:hypothetical protein